MSCDVRESGSSNYAVDLLRRRALAEGLRTPDQRYILHNDYSSTLKHITVLRMVTCHGQKTSYSPPRVADRNSLIKALVCTANCRPQFLEKGFTDTEQASDWVSSLVRWYTNDHGPHCEVATSDRCSDMHVRIVPLCFLKNPTPQR